MDSYNVFRLDWTCNIVEYTFLKCIMPTPVTIQKHIDMATAENFVGTDAEENPLAIKSVPQIQYRWSDKPDTEQSTMGCSTLLANKQTEPINP